MDELHLLGCFACERSGVPIDLPLGLQRLAAFLALHGISHRCLVAGALWPEVPETQALASLRTSVWRMNRLAAGLLETVGDALRLPPAARADNAAQERVVDDVLSHQYVDDSTLAALCQPELLAGWYDDWVVFERERLSQLRLHALEVATRLFVDRGRLDVALRLALEAVRTEPLRETANEALIAVYIAEGNASDAIQRYQLYRELLWRELELEPSPRLGRLLPRRGGVLTPM
jgi:DNA-binding SARP family transcriptional activator